LPEGYLNNNDKDSDEFKIKIKKLNFET